MFFAVFAQKQLTFSGEYEQKHNLLLFLYKTMKQRAWWYSGDK